MTDQSSGQDPTGAERASRLEELEAENRDLQRLAAGLRKAMSDLRSGELERLDEVEARLDEAIEQRDEALAERDDAIDEARNATRRLKQVEASFTWKAGRAIKRLIDPLLALIRRSKRSAQEPADRSPPPVREADPAAGRSADPKPSGGAAPKGPKPTDRAAAAAASLTVQEDKRMKSEYEAATSKRSFSDDGRKRVVMAVSTLDFEQGRGDLFVAVGLGRYLERIGYDVVYLPKGEWSEPPPGTDIYVALLSSVDASRVPDGPLKVAWARNETERWAANPTLNLYDLLLASSERTLDALEETYAGPTGLLPIGVDLELFHPDESTERTTVVSTVNQWGRERDVYAALRGQRIRFPLAIFGQTRGLSPDLASYSHGPVSFFTLPGIYRQATVVLDDFNHTTVEYGNVNSRIFESIASGAVPAANTGLGLKELELGAVPTYTTAAELHETATTLTSDSEARALLAEELAEVVRREHSFERRAEQFDGLVADENRHRRSVREMLAFFPDYRATNPFQAILYRALGSDVIPVPVSDVLEMKELDVSHAKHPILHIHWTAPILAPAKSSAEALARLDEFSRRLESAKSSGARIVWTIHNVMPHESGYPDLERNLRQELADKADIVHIMCDRTREEVGDLYAIPEGKTKLVPHGSYVGVYPDVVDSDLARERLDYHPEDTVILFLGGIRPYKGVDLLLDAFEKAAVREPSLRLLMAGRPGRFPGVRDLERRASSHPLITANFNEIADVDLQHFFKAADVVALPYRTILNSGSAQLAFTFARPVIAPRVACLSGVEADGVGLSFDPGDVEGLVDCLVRATSLKDDAYRRAARSVADSYTGDDMSRDFVDMLRQL